MALCFICVSSLLILSSINYISASPSMITHLKDKKTELMGLHWWCSGRVCLPMQETWVRFLVREDPTCRGAAKLVHHNLGAATTEPVCHVY